MHVVHADVVTAQNWRVCVTLGWEAGAATSSQTQLPSLLRVDGASRT